MSGNEINRRIRKLCEARSWTVYRLAKESGITYSTLSTMLNQDNLPTFPTLEKICGGFGITLSQFFGDDAEFFTAEEKVHLHRWGCLSPEEQNGIERYMDYLLSQKKCDAVTNCIAFFVNY